MGFVFTGLLNVSRISMESSEDVIFGVRSARCSMQASHAQPGETQNSQIGLGPEETTIPASFLVFLG